MALSGVTLGVEIVGAEVGVKTAFAESIAAADEWAKSTEAAGIQAARAFDFVGLSAAKAELAYGKFGDTILATNAKIDKSLITEADAMRINQEAAVRYMSVTEGMAARQAAASETSAAAAERGAMRYQAALIGAGKTLTTYVTLPLAVAGYASIKLATDFQASMERIRTYAGATQKEVNSMGQMILGHAGELPQGPIVSSEAVYHLESIGIRGKAAFDALHAASIATGAGMADLTDATTALGGALVSTVKGASNAKEAMAGLVAIAGMGNMTMQDLSNALGTGLLAKAANVGVPLRDIGSALAVLVDRGIPARRSATYLGTTLALMAAPSKVATNALADMGIKADNMATMLQQPNGLLHILDMLHAGMEKVGKAQGARDLMEAFGRSRQSTGIVTLVESLDAPVSSYSQKLAQYDRGVKDAAERMAAYQQTAQYKFHTSLSLLEADLIRVGTGAMGPLATAMKGLALSITNVVNAFDKLPAGAREALGVIAAFMAVGGPILLGIGMVLKLFDQMGIALEKLGIGGRQAGSEAGAGIASIGTDAAAAAPEVDTLTTQVEALNLALANTRMEAVSGAVPFGGGAFIRSPGQGIIGSSKSLATLGAPLQEGGPQAVYLGGRVLGTTESLSPEVMSALGLDAMAVTTAGEEAGASLFASVRNGLSGAVASAGGARGIMAGVGRASLYGFGGLLAGQMVQTALPGRTGQEIATPLELAGVGAAIGTMTPFGPVGTAAGAGIGALAGGIIDLIHSGPSFQQTMQNDMTAVKSLGQQAHQAALTVSQLQLSRLQIQDQISKQEAVVQQATRRYVGTSPGTAARTAASRALREAQLELSVMQQQLTTNTDNLTNAEKNQQAIAQQRQRTTADEVGRIAGIGAAYRNYFHDISTGARMTSEDVSIHTQIMNSGLSGAKTAAQAFAAEMFNMAKQAQSSDPHLATVYRDIGEITQATNKLPTAHQILVMLKVKAEVDQTARELFRVGSNGLLSLNLPGLPGYVPPGGRADRGKTPPKQPRETQLSQEQAIQVALAKNPKDRAAIEAQVRYDEAQIQHLKRLKAEGQITASEYVTQVSAFYHDINSMTSSLTKAKTNTKATTAFDKKVREDNLMAKARLDMENGQYQQAQRLLAEDKKRLEIMLKEAKNAEERNAILRQLLEVEKLQKSKEGSFAESMKLQEQMARADALAALDTNLTGPSALQMRLAREAKAQAMKAINSHTLTMQGLIDAWNVVGQANATIAQGLINQANLYHAVSSDSITDAVKGLSATQELQLRERISQAEAHRGHAPNDQGAATSGGGGGGGSRPRRGGGGGRPPVADAPHGTAHGGSVIRIDGPMNFYGVQNVKQLEAELESLRRQKHGRAGARR